MVHKYYMFQVNDKCILKLYVIRIKEFLYVIRIKELKIFFVKLIVI